MFWGLWILRGRRYDAPERTVARHDRWRGLACLALVALLGCPVAEPDEEPVPDDDDAGHDDDDVQLDDDDVLDDDDTFDDDDVVDDDDSHLWPDCPDGTLQPPVSRSDLQYFCAAGCREIAGNLGIWAEEQNDDDDPGWGYLVDDLACLEAVHGTLEIHDLPWPHTDLELPALEAVGADLFIDILDWQTLSVSFPELRTVGGGVTVDESWLEVLSLPLLQSAAMVDIDADALAVLDLQELRETSGTDPRYAGFTLRTEALDVEFPGLVAIAGELLVWNWFATTTAFPALEEVAGDVDLMVPFGSLAFPALESIGSSPWPGSDAGLTLACYPEAEGQTLALPQLAVIEGALVVQRPVAVGPWHLQAPLLQEIGHDLQVGENAGLPTLDLPQLAGVGGSVVIESNPLLAGLGLQSLASVVGDLVIQANPALPTAQAEELVDQVGEDNIGGSVLIDGNGP